MPSANEQDGGIFLIQSSGDLVEMKEQPYDTEEVLQELLARYPNLLAGEQMDGAVPRRWLLISREMGVPGEREGADRWSLDHLFLDQDATPTLIEVKRASDTRIRREVVGQMLDYAANAVVYWPVEAIRARFEELCRQRGADPLKELETFLGPNGEPEAFWQRVKVNLQAHQGTPPSEPRQLPCSRDHLLRYQVSSSSASMSATMPKFFVRPTCLQCVAGRHAIPVDPIDLAQLIGIVVEARDVARQDAMCGLG
jgi:hypothetical protein